MKNLLKKNKEESEQFVRVKDTGKPVRHILEKNFNPEGYIQVEAEEGFKTFIPKEKGGADELPNFKPEDTITSNKGNSDVKEAHQITIEDIVLEIIRLEKEQLEYLKRIEYNTQR